MIAKVIFGILTGGTMVAWAGTSFEADVVGVLVPYSASGSFVLVGLGLVGLGMWGRKRDLSRNTQGTEGGHE